MYTIVRRCLQLILAVTSLLLFIPTVAQQYKFDFYQQAQGLRNISVQDLAVDRAGFLWVATANGLYRLLGSRFERFGPEQGISERNVRAVYVDPDGRIWAGTSENLYAWDGSRFHPAGSKPVQTFGPHHLLATKDNQMLAVDDETLVELKLDARGSLIAKKAFFTREQIAENPRLKIIGALARAIDGTLWLGCDHSLCSYKDGRLKVFGPAAGVGSDTWLTIYVDTRGSLWAASKDRLLELPNGAAKFMDRTPSGIDGRLFHWSPILEDHQGRILVEAEAGLSRWDGTSWRTIGSNSGFVDYRITALAMDSNGDPWVGTLNGLSHWTGYDHWEGWSDKQGLPSSIVWSISALPSGDVLLGTVKGPAELGHGKSGIKPLATQPWTYGQVGGIARDKHGGVWAATFYGTLLRIDSQTGRLAVVADLATYIRRIMIDPGGRLWIISANGIDVLDDTQKAKSQPRHVAEADALLGSAQEIFSMAIAPSGNQNPDIWLLAQAGVLRFHAGQWSLPSLTGLAFSEIRPKEISSSADGSLWIAGMDETQHAALWHLLPQGEAFTAVRLALPENLSSVLPFGLLVDHRGWIWLSTDVGLAGFNGSIWRTFTEESGLIWNDTNRGVLTEAMDGSIWVGTPAGAGHLLDPETIFDPVRLSVAITSMDRGSATIEHDAVLPWQKVPLRVHFAAPATWNRSSLMFSYRFAGQDSPWISTQDSQAAFPALPPGAYRFEVRAYSPEIASSSPITAISFVILPPWWRTVWFYSLCAVAAALLLWLLLWLRTRHLLANKLHLQRLVRERTSELEKSEESLRIQATHDALTGLLNRATILESLEQEIDRARRERTLLAVLMADVDHFKRVNDTYGHLAGDTVLRHFARDLSQNIRTYDHAGRYGGEEFLLVLSNISEADLAERLHNLHSRISNLGVSFEEHNLIVTCSIGVSLLLPNDLETNSNQMLSAADAALYKAKHAGRNRLMLAEYESIDDALRVRVAAVSAAN